MSHKIEGQSAWLAHQLIKQLAEIQLIMEKGHFDTLRAVLRHVQELHPNETPIKYPTAQAWLNQERNKILMKK